MIYSYRCQVGHTSEVNARIGEASETEVCPKCAAISYRDFHADFSGVTFGVVDPFRSFDLSCARTRAEGEQQRALDAPRDNFERRHLERTHGRTYIGNETGHMIPRHQEAIAKYQERKAAGERV